MAVGPAMAVTPPPGPVSGLVEFDSDLNATGHPGPVLTVAADNTTINGNGFRIIAPDASVVIQSSGWHNITIENLELVTASPPATNAVYVAGGTNPTIEQVAVGPAGRAIYLHGCDGAVVTGCSSTGAGEGILVHSSNNVTV
ncbi:MAG: hypothetical protein PVH68_16235, partial [Armatimonadota bacterium]